MTAKKNEAAAQSAASQDQQHEKRTIKPTDDELGDRLIESFAGLTRHFYGQWYRYADGVWTASPRDVKRAIWDVLKAAKFEGIRPSDSKVNSVDAYLVVELTVTDEAIDNAGPYINLQNGLLNTDTIKLERHRSDLFLTSQLPFAFDPKARCPTFINFLSSVLVDENGKTDPDLMALVSEAVGYSLTLDTSRRVSFWLVGESGSGKSTLIDVLIALAGTSGHTTIDLDQLGKDNYQLAEVAGKRLITFTEPDSRGVLSDSHYKRLVSQDVISARQIYGKAFRFVPVGKLWGAMNETPRVVDRSDAVFNRVIIIPMPRVIPEHMKDLNLKAKLEAELPGIFNWALMGLTRLRKQGHFTKAAASVSAREDYKLENDIEAAFIADWVRRGDDDDTVRANRLYDAYSIWCKRNGSQPKSSTKVAKDWKRLKFIKQRDNQGMFYKGLKLTNEAFKATEFAK